MPKHSRKKFQGQQAHVYRRRPRTKTGKKKRNILLENEQWDDYLSKVDRWIIDNNKEYGAVSDIARQEDCNRRTLAYQWKKWGTIIHDEGWSDDLRARINRECRGGYNRVFTIDQERTLNQRLYHYHADCGLVIDGKVIEREALLLVDELQQHLSSQPTCNSIIDGFKKRWGWTSERVAAHPMKPPPIETEVKAFATRCKQLADRLPARLVINLDETKIKQTNKLRSALRLPKQHYSVNRMPQPKVVRYNEQ